MTIYILILNGLPFVISKTAERYKLQTSCRLHFHEYYNHCFLEKLYKQYISEFVIFRILFPTRLKFLVSRIMVTHIPQHIYNIYFPKLLQLEMYQAFEIYNIQHAYVCIYAGD